MIISFALSGVQWRGAHADFFLAALFAREMTGVPVRPIFIPRAGLSFMFAVRSGRAPQCGGEISVRIENRLVAAEAS
ncbi:hypothetical protein [uncultured Bradyrhizobium sp.]|jgi:hypothetical protein|uniref:hypothetical protein n=1 Tax=uncultured Bradyrhizobium sp. TaxID=199684 RepID=UPI0034308F18